MDDQNNQNMPSNDAGMPAQGGDAGTPAPAAPATDTDGGNTDTGTPSTPDAPAAGGDQPAQ